MVLFHARANPGAVRSEVVLAGLGGVARVGAAQARVEQQPRRVLRAGSRFAEARRAIIWQIIDRIDGEQVVARLEERSQIKQGGFLKIAARTDLPRSEEHTS